MKGRSIDKRPDIVNAGTEIGHWEVDTVVGNRNGHKAVIFTAVEKVTRNHIAIRIPGRTQRPRRILDYHSPAELFEAFLDEVYAIDNIY